MAGLFGAIKGVWRGMFLLVAVALIPGLAFLAGVHGQGFIDLGFWTIFFAVLALELFLGVCALFGLASEIQKPDDEAVRRASQQHGAR